VCEGASLESGGQERDRTTDTRKKCCKGAKHMATRSPGWPPTWSGRWRIGSVWPIIVEYESRPNYVLPKHDTEPEKGTLRRPCAAGGRHINKT
jgi:hypothetical protein